MHLKNNCAACLRFLMIAVVGLGCGFGKAWAVAESGAQNRVVHDIPLRGLNGPSTTLAAYQGKVLLVNMWASWCGPCRAEMGALERLAWQEQARPQGPRFVVLGISTDDSEAAAKNYLRAANATINQYIDTALQAEKMLGANRLPLTVLIGADGKVLGKYYGAQEWDGPWAAHWLADHLARAR
jgi:thiol-disulfide isomerase/thioredoxin